jgi:ferredoxin
VRSEIAQWTGDAEFYLCGPGPFMDLVERVLHDAGVPTGRIFSERFEFAAPAETERPAARRAGAAGAPATITLHLDGATHEIPYAAGDTLLQTARKAGLSPPSACEDGYCGCCMATLLRGEVAMAHCHALDDDDRARGMILTCQARPTSGAIEVCWD